MEAADPPCALRRRPPRPSLFLLQCCIALLALCSVAHAQEEAGDCTVEKGECPQPADGQTRVNGKTYEEWMVIADRDVQMRKGVADAIQAYTNAIEADRGEKGQDRYSNYYKRAAAYLLDGATIKALRDLDVVVKKKPDFLYARQRRGKVYVTLGRLADAKAEFEAVLADKPDNGIAQAQMQVIAELEKLVEEAQAAQRTGNMQQCVDAFTKVIETASESVDARVKRARCHLAAKNLNQAIDDAMRALKIDGSSTEALYVRAVAFHQIGQEEAAVNHLRECLRMDMDHRRCKDEMKKYKKVSQTIKAAQEHTNAGRWKEALEEYKSLLELDPEHPSATNEWALQICQAHSRLREYDQAIRQCDAVIQADGENLEAMLLKAEALLALDRFDEAIRWFQNVHQRDMGNQRARQGLHNAQRKQKMAARKDHYKILGVAKDASMAEIRRTYRRLAVEWHPDKYSGEDKVAAQQRFVDINEAYEVLGDDDKRRRYDNGEDLNEQQGHGGGGFPFGFQGGQGFSFSFNF